MDRGAHADAWGWWRRWLRWTGRFNKEDLDDGCNNKYMPSDFYMELLFRSTDSRKAAGHPLDACIPANPAELNGKMCYFPDAAQNARYVY